MTFIIVLFLQNQADITIIGCSENIDKQEKHIKSPCQGAFFCSQLSKFLLILKLSLAFFREATRQPISLDCSLTGF
jgi:hypothetical protein